MRARVTRVVVALALAAAAIAVAKLRHPWLVGSWFTRGAPIPSLRLPSAQAMEPLSKVDRVRVVILDGLSAAVAAELPNLDAMCTVDLGVDVGFPAVSLPVQRVLWTGLTQQQAGVSYDNARLVVTPDGIPPRVPGAKAVSESHHDIIRSFGFTETHPPTDEKNPLWRDGGFPTTALDLVRSDAPLVAVHVLRIDETGHKKGGASPEYRAAAEWGDKLLGDLVAADRIEHPDGGTRWFVLSDHGQSPKGGHGDAEPAIRLVRACLGGDVSPDLRGARGSIHLVDLSRAVAESAGVELPPGGAGRTLRTALASPPSPGWTLPRPDTWRWVVALALGLLGLWATMWAARGAGGLLLQPIWWPFAYFALLASKGAPTLSSGMVWKIQGRTIAEGILPGLILLAVMTTWALVRGASVRRLVVGQLALPAALAAAALVLAGLPSLPPLMPMWSARASAWLVFLFMAMMVVALPVLVSAFLPRIDRSSARGTGDRSRGARGPSRD